MKTLYHIEILKSKNREHYWRIIHRNGREICRSSETYKRARDCRRGLMRMLDGIAELQIDWR